VNDEELHFVLCFLHGLKYNVYSPIAMDNCYTHVYVFVIYLDDLYVLCLLCMLLVLLT
jgi:hypothetical protein